MFQAWCKLWGCVWLGTSLGGGLFGLGLGLVFFVLLFGSPSGVPVGIIFGFIMGALWAGTVGVFVIPSFALLMYLSSPGSWLLREAEERRLDNLNHPFSFSIASLFLRTTAAAFLIAFWTVVIRNIFDNFR